MPGSAVLDTSLVDSLLPVVDSLRELHTSFGTRSWQVYTVKRTWSGSRRGEGNGVDPDYTDSAVELTPSPEVMDRRRRMLDPTGMDEVGEVELHEVSLTYTETDLLGAAGGNLAANVEFFYKLVGTHGQLQVTRYFVIGKRPVIADREKTIGWIVTLERAEGVD